MALACAFASLLSRYLVVATSGVSLLWPTSGVALAAILKFGWHAGFAVYAGTFAAACTTESPALESAAVSLVYTLEPLLGAFLLGRLGSFHRELDRLRICWRSPQ